MNSRIVLVVLLSAVLIALTPGPASAGTSAPLTICNKTAETLTIAFGYHSPGVNDPADHSVLTGPFVSRGWGRIASGECHTFSNPFNARYMFWFGLSGTRIFAGPESNTTDALCVPNWLNGGTIPAFTYEDENQSSEACMPSGSTANVFMRSRAVDTWVDPVVNFTGQ
jgi:uncharacterized membrane protein